MFAVCVTFRIHPDSLEAFQARVRRQAADSVGLEAGCQRFDVWRDAKRPGEVFLYEVYSDAAAFRDHLESAHFKAFDADTRDWILERDIRTWDSPA